MATFSQIIPRTANAKPKLPQRITVFQKIPMAERVSGDDPYPISYVLNFNKASRREVISLQIICGDFRCSLDATDQREQKHQDVNRRPLACEACSYRACSLTHVRRANDLSEDALVSLPTVSTWLLHCTDKRRYSDSGQTASLCRPGRRLPLRGKQKVPSNTPNLSPFFFPVRVLCESLTLPEGRL